MFLGLAADEARHLRLLLIEYSALESGRGWINPNDALEEELTVDAANPHLPGEEYPEVSLIFSPAREPSVDSDIAALEFAMETEKLSYDLYQTSAEDAIDTAAKQSFGFLAREENQHYELLQNTLNYLTDNETWWDDEQLPFFIG